MSSLTQGTARSRTTELGGAVGFPAVAGVATWLVIDPVAGVDLAIHSGDTTQHIGWPAVLVASVVAGVAGWILLAVLRRFAKRARRIWTAIAVAVLIVSLAGPLGGVDAASRWCLAALHLAVGATTIAVLRRTAGPSGR